MTSPKGVPRPCTRALQVILHDATDPQSCKGVSNWPPQGGTCVFPPAQMYINPWNSMLFSRGPHLQDNQIERNNETSLGPMEGDMLLLHFCHSPCLPPSFFFSFLSSFSFLSFLFQIKYINSLVSISNHFWVLSCSIWTNIWVNIQGSFCFIHRVSSLGSSVIREDSNRMWTYRRPRNYGIKPSHKL